MKRSSITTLGILVAIVLLVTSSVPAPAQVQRDVALGPAQPDGFWGTAYNYTVSTAFWANGQPHYGAFFNGGYGHNQHYVKENGDPTTCASSSGCIGNWNWWGNTKSVLLLPKSGWLFAVIPWTCPRWCAWSYQATVYVW